MFSLDEEITMPAANVDKTKKYLRTEWLLSMA
jgi:hypothetical protein